MSSFQETLDESPLANPEPTLLKTYVCRWKTNITITATKIAIGMTNGGVKYFIKVTFQSRTSGNSGTRLKAGQGRTIYRHVLVCHGRDRTLSSASWRIVRLGRASSSERKPIGLITLSGFPIYLAPNFQDTSQAMKYSRLVQPAALSMLQ